MIDLQTFLSKPGWSLDHVTRELIGIAEDWPEVLASAHLHLTSLLSNVRKSR